MAIHAEFTIKGKLLVVKASGIDEGLDEAIRYSVSVFNYAMENNIQEIFCDECDLKYNLTDVETFDLAANASKVATGKRLRVAILCHEQASEAGMFFENVARNRGLFIKVSANRNQLAEWLGFENAL